MPNTIAEILVWGIRTLQGVSGSPRLDAQLMLAHVIQKPREYLIAHGEYVLTEIEQHTFEKLLMLRTKGMPIAYILGERPFYDRTFRVTSHVLIPRPETENLVEAALDWVRSLDHPPLIIDVGTGSGIIALTLAAHLPDSRVVAADVSAAALLIARENGADLTNVSYVQADLMAPLRGPFDLICANLPYIATGEMNLLEVAKFEPHVALDGGADGLFLLRRLLKQAPSQLNKSGLLLLEIGADQGAAVAELARAAFPDAQVEVVKDYAGLDRIVRVEQFNIQ